jgi:hypothetical protein
VWLTIHGSGWIAPVWAHTNKYTPLISSPDEEIYKQEHWHILAIAFDGLARLSPKFSFLRHKYGTITYSTVVQHFNLSPQFLIAHGFEPDGIITRAMLEPAWQDMVWGEELTTIVLNRNDHVKRAHARTLN